MKRCAFGRRVLQPGAALGLRSISAEPHGRAISFKRQTEVAVKNFAGFLRTLKRAATIGFRGMVLVTCSGLSLLGCAPSGDADHTGPAAGEDGPDGSITATDAARGTGADRDSALGSLKPGTAMEEGSVADAGARDPSRAGDALADLRCQADAHVSQRTDYAQPGPHAVGTIELTFEDDSRPIVATDAHPAAPSRTLVTTIYYPASEASLLGAAPLAEGGPFPMLMYSHGYSSTRGEATPVANHAASYGYIVVVPDFPLTNGLANGGAPDVTDAAHQPGDVSFLIDQLLSFSADPNHLLANAVDETRIGALGVSLGGLTTLLVTFHPRLHDPRIKVAMPIAALSLFFGDGFYHTRAVPLLILHGDLDAFVNYELNGRRSFMRAAPNARLVTLAKGSHAAFGAQLDPTLQKLLIAVLGPDDADPDNPDALGCGVVGETLNMTGPNFLQELGGPENFIEPDATALQVCRGDEYTRPAMDANEQEQIAVRSAVAFFDAHFANAPETRHDGCRYLLYELPKLPGVTLE